MIKRYGLQAEMKRSYAWITFGVVCVIIAMYGGFIADQMYFAASHGVSGFSQGSYPWEGALVMILLAAVVTPLLGGMFGVITTRGIIWRIQQLGEAVERIADGDYALRVSVSGYDEIGQLEEQFKHMAQQLAESMASREALAKENARLAERARITRELHDAISQDLFSLCMLTDGLRQALPAESHLQARITTVEETTKRMIREMRALLLELRPAQLEQLGLVEALQELAALYRDRFDVIVTTDIAVLPLATHIEHALLRISQEALSNAVRHAEATTISLTLELQDEKVTFSIRDDGKGFFDDESKPQHGLGLSLMRERVHEIGGGFELKTTPGQGAQIDISLAQEAAYDSHHDC